MSAEPTSTEVLAWLERTGGSLAEAVAHFWPAATDEQQQETLYQRVKKWRQRARAGSRAASPPPLRLVHSPPPDPGQPQRPEARWDLAKLTTIERLERQVAELWVDLELARGKGDLRTAAALDHQLSERAGELDAARTKAARTLRLDRTPTAVAQELAKKQRAIDLRAEMARRQAERAAKAAELAAQQGEGPAEAK